MGFGWVAMGRRGGELEHFVNSKQSRGGPVRVIPEERMQIDLLTGATPKLYRFINLTANNNVAPFFVLSGTPTRQSRRVRRKQ